MEGGDKNNNFNNCLIDKKPETSKKGPASLSGVIVNLMNQIFSQLTSAFSGRSSSHIPSLGGEDIYTRQRNYRLEEGGLFMIGLLILLNVLVYSAVLSIGYYSMY